jgi:hypothetical protein
MILPNRIETGVLAVSFEDNGEPLSDSLQQQLRLRDISTITITPFSLVHLKILAIQALPLLL